MRLASWLALAGLLVDPTAAVPRGRSLRAGAGNGRNRQQAITIPVTGATNEGNIEKAGGKEWFTFSATGGKTYQVETTLGSLDDTMIDLVNTGARPQSSADLHASAFSCHISGCPG
jgi:hypothetical protein